VAVAESVSERVVVNADPATVLGVITDFASYPRWQDEVQAVEVLATGADGRARRVRFTLDAKVFTTTFVLDYTYADGAGEQVVSWTLAEGDQLRRNDGSYRLRDRGDGTTDLTYALELEPAVALPGIIRRRAAKRIVDGALHNVRARAESRS
jgi:uncharacterized membrane protein